MFSLSIIFMADNCHKEYAIFFRYVGLDNGYLYSKETFLNVAIYETRYCAILDGGNRKTGYVLN